MFNSSLGNPYFAIIDFAEKVSLTICSVHVFPTMLFSPGFGKKTLKMLWSFSSALPHTKWIILQKSWYYELYY